MATSAPPAVPNEVIETLSLWILVFGSPAGSLPDPGRAVGAGREQAGLLVMEGK